MDTLISVYNSEASRKVRGYLATAMRVKLEEIIGSKNNPEPGPSDYSRLSLKEWEEINSDRKIGAIKELRVRTGLGLREAKELIEYLGYGFSRPTWL